jgi:hypothetical protein
MDMLTKFTTRVIIFASLYALSVGSAGARGGKFLITSNDDERDLRNKIPSGFPEGRFLATSCPRGATPRPRATA